MKKIKPGLRNIFWEMTTDRMYYGDACLELRLSAGRGNLWRTDYLIDLLRKTNKSSVEDEIGIAMQKAAINGQLGILKLLFDKRCGLTTWKEKRPTFYTPYSRRIHTINKKQPSGKRNPKRYNWRETSFLYAVEYGNISVVRFFLENGIKVNVNKSRALQLAVRNENVRMTDILVNNHANIRSNDYITYQKAVTNASIQEGNKINCLDVLLTRDINIEKEDMEGLLFCALEGIYVNEETVKKLLNKALTMTDKADITRFLSLSVPYSREITKLLNDYQLEKEKSERKNPANGNVVPLSKKNARFRR